MVKNEENNGMGEICLVANTAAPSQELRILQCLNSVIKRVDTKYHSTAIHLILWANLEMKLPQNQETQSCI